MRLDKEVENYLKSLELEVIEVQPDDKSVGIYEGFCIFYVKEDDYQEPRELSFNQACWHNYNKSDRAAVLADSVHSNFED